MEKIETILHEIEVLKNKLSAQLQLPKAALDKILHVLDIEYTYDSN